MTDQGTPNPDEEIIPGPAEPPEAATSGSTQPEPAEVPDMHGDTSPAAPSPTSPEPAAAAAPAPTSPESAAAANAAPPPAAPPIHPQRRAGVWRAALVALLMLLGALALVSANSAIWLNRTVENTDAWVAAVGPLAKSEAVTTAASAAIAHRVVQAIDIEKLASNVVPGPVAGLIAGPIEQNLEVFAARYLNDFMQTDTFYNIWVRANRFGHEQVKNLLNHTDTQGVVTIDLTPAVQRLDDQLRQRGIDLFHGGNIPPGLGVLQLQTERLGQLTYVLQLLQAFAILLPLAALLLFAGAILFSRSRRRGFIAVGVVSALALALEFVALRLGKGVILGNLRSDVNRAAVADGWNILLQGLYQQTAALLAIALVIAFVAWLAGPTGLAKRMRDSVQSRFGDVRGAGARPDTPLARFLRQWRRQLEIGVIVIALVLLLIVPELTPAIFGIVAVVGVLLILAIEVLAGPAEDLTSPEGPGAA